MSLLSIAEAINARPDNARRVLERLRKAGKIYSDDLINWHLSLTDTGKKTESLPVQKQRRQGEMESHVLDILKEGEGKTKRQLADAIGTTPANLGHVLSRMRDNGLVVQDYIGYWHLPPDKPLSAPTPVVAESTGTGTSTPSFRFGAWDDGSLVIIGPESAIELPAKAARRLAVFLNHHFSQQNI